MADKTLKKGAGVHLTTGAICIALTLLGAFLFSFSYTTNYYIYRKLEETGVKVTVIARGIAQNDELQYTDEVTLGRALAGRIPFGA